MKRQRWRRPAARGAVVAGLSVGAVLVPGLARAHGPASPAPEWPGVLAAWSLDTLPLAGLAVATVGYGWLVRRAEQRHPRNLVPAHRHWAWAAGLAAVGLALLSPIEVYSGALLTVHMVQHVLLQFVAAPLLLLAAPVTLLLRAVSQPLRRVLVGILHGLPLRVIAFPLVAWLVFAAANWGWHFSDLYDQALDNPALHHVQHATLMAAALLFWFPVIGADPGPWRLPYPARLFYLFLAMPQSSFLGVAIMNAANVLYPHYATVVRNWGPEPLDDQQAAGTLMWVWADITFLVVMFALIVAWVRLDERRNARDEARQDADAARRGSLGSR